MKTKKDILISDKLSEKCNREVLNNLIYLYKLKAFRHRAQFELILDKEGAQEGLLFVFKHLGWTIEIIPISFVAKEPICMSIEFIYRFGYIFIREGN